MSESSPIQSGSTQSKSYYYVTGQGEVKEEQKLSENKALRIMNFLLYKINFLHCGKSYDVKDVYRISKEKLSQSKGQTPKIASGTEGKTETPEENEKAIIKRFLTYVKEYTAKEEKKNTTTIEDIKALKLEAGELLKEHFQKMDVGAGVGAVKAPAAGAGTAAGATAAAVTGATAAAVTGATAAAGAVTVTAPAPAAGAGTVTGAPAGAVTAQAPVTAAPAGAVTGAPAGAVTGTGKDAVTGTAPITGTAAGAAPAAAQQNLIHFEDKSISGKQVCYVYDKSGHLSSGKTLGLSLLLRSDKLKESQITQLKTEIQTKNIREVKIPQDDCCLPYLTFNEGKIELHVPAALKEIIQTQYPALTLPQALDNWITISFEKDAFTRFLIQGNFLDASTNSIDAWSDGYAYLFSSESKDPRPHKLSIAKILAEKSTQPHQTKPGLTQPPVQSTQPSSSAIQTSPPPSPTTQALPHGQISTQIQKPSQPEVKATPHPVSPIDENLKIIFGSSFANKCSEKTLLSQILTSPEQFYQFNFSYMLPGSKDPIPLQFVFSAAGFCPGKTAAALERLGYYITGAGIFTKDTNSQLLSFTQLCDLLDIQKDHRNFLVRDMLGGVQPNDQTIFYTSKNVADPDFQSALRNLLLDQGFSTFNTPDVRGLLRVEIKDLQSPQSTFIDHAEYSRCLQPQILKLKTPQTQMTLNPFSLDPHTKQWEERFLQIFNNLNLNADQIIYECFHHNLSPSFIQTILNKMMPASSQQTPTLQTPTQAHTTSLPQTKQPLSTYQPQQPLQQQPQQPLQQPPSQPQPQPTQSVLPPPPPPVTPQPLPPITDYKSSNDPDCNGQLAFFAIADKKPRASFSIGVSLALQTRSVEPTEASRWLESGIEWGKINKEIPYIKRTSGQRAITLVVPKKMNTSLQEKLSSLGTHKEEKDNMEYTIGIKTGPDDVLNFIKKLGLLKEKAPDQEPGSRQWWIAAFSTAQFADLLNPPAPPPTAAPAAAPAAAIPTFIQQPQLTANPLPTSTQFLPPAPSYSQQPQPFGPPNPQPAAPPSFIQPPSSQKSQQPITTTTTVLPIPTLRKIETLADGTEVESTFTIDQSLQKTFSTPGKFHDTSTDTKPPKPVVISQSSFVSTEMTEHLMRHKTDAYGSQVKYNPQGAQDFPPCFITPMEASMHGFITGILGDIRIQGDLYFEGSLNLAEKPQKERTVILSTEIHLDCEKDQKKPPFQSVFLQVAQVTETAVEGISTCPEPSTLSMEQRKSGDIQQYDQQLLQHQVHHLTAAHRRPNLTEIGTPLEIDAAKTLIQTLIANKKSQAEITHALQNKGAKIGDKVISLEILYNSYMQKLRNELFTLDKLCTKGFIYTIDPPSIFMDSFGHVSDIEKKLSEIKEKTPGDTTKIAALEAQLLEAKEQKTSAIAIFNSMQCLAFTTLLPSLKNLKQIIMSGVPDESRKIVKLYNSTGIDIAVYKEDIQVDGHFLDDSLWGDAALVLHNNSDGFYLNLLHEDTPFSLDGAISLFTDVKKTSSIQPNRADLTQKILRYRSPKQLPTTRSDVQIIPLPISKEDSAH